MFNHMTTPADMLETATAGVARIGINFGNALLTGRDAAGRPIGIAVELAQALAARAGLTLEIVPYDAAGRMADGARDGSWDAAFLAVDPERAQDIEFTAPYLEVETTYLVPAESSLRRLDEVDGRGVRISVSRKSAYDLFLSRTLRQAELVRTPTPPESIEAFFQQRLDALAGLRPLLMDVAEKHPQTRILDGSFMTVRQAIGVPKGRPSAAAYAEQFLRELKASEKIAEIVASNGVRGVRLV